MPELIPKLLVITSAPGLMGDGKPGRLLCGSKPATQTYMSENCTSSEAPGYSIAMRRQLPAEPETPSSCPAMPDGLFGRAVATPAVQVPCPPWRMLLFATMLVKSKTL